MSTAAHVNALFAHAPAQPAVPVRLVRRAGAVGVLSVPAAGMELCREETAAALFEVYTDEHAVPDMSTDALYDLLQAAVYELGPAGLLETTDTFAELDSAEFWEVGACRWYAYRLALSFWYQAARSRPMTAGEAAAALYLSDYTRTATHPTAPDTTARKIRQVSAQIPTPILLRLGRALTARMAGVPDPTGSGEWLSRRLLPDHQRARRCFTHIRSNPTTPLPLIVRTDAGQYAVGAVPPAGPGNRWAQPLQARW
ncbi:hypothetical protein [Streptomyces sp. ODS05-4]|uniref:hypothetical protein n=1 Tax=Streptomyces sp. ODS05-4 TaxID=2944939 RepID=UPI0021096C13|nr:hypothetical protein [Streptomyces sp. ODS05-4]